MKLNAMRYLVMFLISKLFELEVDMEEEDQYRQFDAIVTVNELPAMTL
jgi:hypothetical protein